MVVLVKRLLKKIRCNCSESFAGLVCSFRWWIFRAWKHHSQRQHCKALWSFVANLFLTIGLFQVNLLADLDMGGGDEDYAYDEGAVADDDGDWGDKTIRVENKRAPPPPPSF